MPRRAALPLRKIIVRNPPVNRCVAALLCLIGAGEGMSWQSAVPNCVRQCVRVRSNAGFRSVRSRVSGEAWKICGTVAGVAIGVGETGFERSRDSVFETDLPRSAVAGLLLRPLGPDRGTAGRVTRD